MTSRILIPFVLILLMMLLGGTAESLVAQAPPGFPGDPDQVPVDGGLSLLAAAGGAYALRRLRQKSSNRTTNADMHRR
ncbi:MAG: PID-CTERM protein-sorting domain-containing protein [Cyclonatronaceae bacterium]